jgi:ribonuclease HI
LNRLEVFTDGSCKGFTQKSKKHLCYGGWAFLHVEPEADIVEYRSSGSEEKTTSNRMELIAVLRALLAINRIDVGREIVVYSDSAYTVNAFKLGWIEKWEGNNWRAKSGKVKNQDLWIPLVWLSRQFPNITFKHVKGHNGNKYNEEVDKLAQDAALALQIEAQPDFLETKKNERIQRNRRWARKDWKPVKLLPKRKRKED